MYIKVQILNIYKGEKGRNGMGMGGGMRGGMGVHNVHCVHKHFMLYLN